MPEIFLTVFCEAVIRLEKGDAPFFPGIRDDKDVDSLPASDHTTRRNGST